MSSKVAHLDYEVRQIVCRATKKTPDINTPGLSINSVEGGQEFSTWFWASRELVESGFADYVAEPVTQTEWTQVHFKERLNPAAPPGPMPDGFYARVYQSFVLAKVDDDKASIVNRMRARFRDILESRVGRITRMASAEADSPTSPLQEEEEQLYGMIHQQVSAWRTKMRELGE